MRKRHLRGAWRNNVPTRPVALTPPKVQLLEVTVSLILFDRVFEPRNRTGHQAIVNS